MLALVVLVTVTISLNQERLSSLAAFGYLGAFFVMALSNATVILPAPGLIFVFALGSSLHPLQVGLFAGVGATLGELTGYIAGYIRADNADDGWSAAACGRFSSSAPSPTRYLISPGFWPAPAASRFGASWASRWLAKFSNQARSRWPAPSACPGSKSCCPDPHCNPGHRLPAVGH